MQLNPVVCAVARRCALPSLLVALLGAAACTDSTPAPAAWPVDSASVVGTRGTRSESLRVDIFVDATVSMAGYAASPTSEYVRFLDDLESTVKNAAWPKADVHFYRFGDAFHEIPRETYAVAAKTPAFYTEKVTGIDRVIDCRVPSNVSIVLTDLFQSEGDVNSIVGQIKDRCLQKGVSVAALGIKSAFNGTVFDARVPSYKYASTADTASYRPFYALMFGSDANLQWLLSQLAANKPNRRNFAVIAPVVVQSYSVTMKKEPRTSDMNAQGSSGYQSSFTLLKGHQGGTMLADVTITPAPGAPPVHPEALDLVAFRLNNAHGKQPRDSVVTQDITLQPIEGGSGNPLHLKLKLALADPPGTYQYKLVLRTGGVGGFGVQPWVDRYSSDNPTPSADANKTLNLTKFIVDLRRAASSIAQPPVAVWYVTIRKL